MDKAIVVAALTGAQQSKEANPNLPVQPDEIVEQAVACWRAGAAIVHIHARDREGKSTGDVNIFRDIVEGIKSRCDVVINLTTRDAIAGLPLEERIAMVPALKPEVASFSVGLGMVGRYDLQMKRWQQDFTMSLSYSDLEHIARTMLDHGTKPELEIYYAGMINNALILRDIGVLEEPLYFNLVMGIPGQCNVPTPKNLLYLVESLPPGCQWQVTGIGRHEFPLVAMSIVLGGNVRVGLEDNVYIEKGKLAKSNAQLVEKAVYLVHELGRETATPGEARRILRLKGGTRK